MIYLSQIKAKYKTTQTKIRGSKKAANTHLKLPDLEKVRVGKLAQVIIFLGFSAFLFAGLSAINQNSNLELEAKQTNQAKIITNYNRQDTLNPNRANFEAKLIPPK
jgi:hypothetical protein